MIRSKYSIEFATDFSPEESVAILKQHIEPCEDFDHKTTGNNEAMFFLGKMGRESFLLKRNVFKSQFERHRFSLLVEGRISRGSNGKGHFNATLAQFPLIKFLNNFTLVLLSLSALAIGLSYEQKEVYRFIGGTLAMLAILFVFIWYSNWVFRLTQSDIEKHLKKILTQQ